MKIVRTPRAIDGFREVASYVARQFGNKALQEFRQRVKEWTDALKKMPWREVVPVDVSISNLEQMLRLCKGYKECKTDKDYETVFNTFYKTYMKTNRLSWYLTQKRLKEEIELILNPKNKVVDGTAKDVTNNSDNGNTDGQNTNNSDNGNTDGQNTSNSDNTDASNTDGQNTTSNIEDVESKWKTALNSLTIIQTCFKGSDDSEVLKAIEKLSEKITEMLDKVTD